MQKLIQQIYSTQQDIQCQKCKGSQGTFISLTCDHKFCVLCLSFMYAKHRKQDPNQGSVKCIICSQITNLHPSHLQIVTNTLKQQVVPIIQQNVNSGVMITRNGYSLQHSLIGTRKIKSQQHSFQHNITPSTNKCFFSKCQSPNSFKKNKLKINCQIHRSQHISCVCFTCQLQPLCDKCISGTKKHQNHQVRNLQKTLSIMIQQSQQVKLQLNFHTASVQNNLKKFQQRGQMIRKRCQKSINDIKKNFDVLNYKLQKKKQQLLEQCQQNLNQLLSYNNKQVDMIKQYLHQLDNFHNRLIYLQKQSDNFDFIYKWQQTKNQFSINPPFNFQQQLINKIRLPSSSILKQLDQICTQSVSLNLTFKNVNLSIVGQIPDLNNCRSQSKFRKDNKRLKTNFVSLNSSRQKKLKKNTKTQQDQRRLRTEKVVIQRDKKNTKMPAYITDYINKKAFRFGNDGNLTALQGTTNADNSKITSKLSKTITPQQLAKKKKDNMALIKQRMQRKTTQPLNKRNQSNKKKKVQ